jgi:hypothetical protein
MPSSVNKCGIEECQYNNNFQCHADGIEVLSSGTKKVKNSAHTMCDTFIPKQS